MNDDQFKQILGRLDVIGRLLALNLPKDLNQTQKIEILSGMGLQPKEIATILGTTSNTVSVTLNDLKKSAKKKKISSGSEKNVKSS